VEPTLAGISLLLLQIAMGIGLAACAGLRAFLPLFVVGLAGRLDVVPLTATFEWMGSTPALVVFGVAVVTEILADKIPVVDHFLDVAQSFVKPIAGTVLAASVLTELTPLQAAVLGLITGGAVSGVIHVTKAKVRLASTATTAGLGNPVISTLEDVGAFFGSLVAIWLPLLLLLLLVAAIILTWTLLRRMRLPRSDFRA
jgi:uncharacterized membrane protein